MGERQKQICLDRNERTVPFPPEVFRDMLRTVQSDLFNRYPNPDPLYERLSRRIELPMDHLYLTNGSDAALRMLFQVFIRPGDKVVFAHPAYAMYAIYAKIFQAVPQTVEYGADLTLDLRTLLETLKQRPRLLVLANPDQPTGAVLAPDALHQVATSAKDHGVLLIVDEAYFPFYPKTAIGWVPTMDHLVVTRTFSKAFGLAGLRLGYLAAQPAIIRAVGQVRGAHEVNAMAIAMGSYMLDHPELSQELIRQLEKGRSVLKRAAEELRLEFPPCPANFQLMGFPGLDSTQSVVGVLKSKGYEVKGNFTFPALRRFIRVTLSDADTLEGFIQALKSTLTELAWTPR